MSAAIYHLPADPQRLRAALSAVRARARKLHATPQARSRAIAALLRELNAGRSTAAAVALANGALRRIGPCSQGGVG